MDNLLLESGDYLLLENGVKLLLESADDPAASVNISPSANYVQVTGP